MHLRFAADRALPEFLLWLWLYNDSSHIPLRVADVREELLATLTALADFSYGWGLLDAYLPRLQSAVSIISMLPGHRVVSANLPPRACGLATHK